MADDAHELAVFDAEVQAAKRGEPVGVLERKALSFYLSTNAPCRSFLSAKPPRRRARKGAGGGGVPATREAGTPKRPCNEPAETQPKTPDGKAEEDLPAPPPPPPRRTRRDVGGGEPASYRYA